MKCRFEVLKGGSVLIDNFFDDIMIREIEDDSKEIVNVYLRELDFEISKRGSETLKPDFDVVLSTFL